MQTTMARLMCESSSQPLDEGLASASAVLMASPLQRRLRDIHAAGQHVVAGQRVYVRAGAQYLGFPPVAPISGRNRRFPLAPTSP
jgi:hypothetical protein